MTTLESVQRRVRMASRAIGRHGLAHAYGHCSERIDSQTFLVGVAKPMGLVGSNEAGIVVSIDGALPPDVLGEVRLHQQIYRRRVDVGAIVRSMPPALMALGTARRVPQPRHGLGAYFGIGAALWDEPQLLRADDSASALAEVLADRAAIVMRGNGVVVVADSLPRAVGLTWYLEDAARLELAVLSAGLEASSVVLTPDECRRRATAAGGIFERMWQYLTTGDPESDSS